MPHFVDADATDVEVHDDRFIGAVLGNAWLERLATGFRWVEGPVWMGDWDCLLFQDLPANRTMRWTDGLFGAEGHAEIFRAPSHYANGQARDREGRLLACSQGLRAVTRTERDGSVTTIADSHDGLRFNAPNDIVVRRDGAIWFTDPLYGLLSDYEGGRRPSEQRPAVYRIPPGSDRPERMVDDLVGPNGLAFSPDERRFYVSETGDESQPDPDRFIRVYDVAEDGALSNGREFARIAPGCCDGMAIDENGWLWSSAEDGVHVFAPDGTLLGKIFVPERVSNLAFGGRLLNRLFITGATSLYALTVNVRGAAV